MKNKILLGIGLMACFLVSTTTQGIECISKEGCASSLEKMLKHAHDGLPEAQLLVGLILSEGKYVKQDDDEAFIWYKKAANNKLMISAAYHAVGMSYLNGKGTKRNVSKGLGFLRTAAKDGFVNSQLILGLELYEGINAQRDLKMARHWFELAANANSPLGAYMSAEFAEHGLGGKEDIEKAAKYYMQAAKQQYNDSFDKLVAVQMLIQSHSSQSEIVSVLSEEINLFNAKAEVQIQAVDEPKMMIDLLAQIDDWKKNAKSNDTSIQNRVTSSNYGKFDHLKGTSLDYGYSNYTRGKYTNSRK